MRKYSFLVAVCVLFIGLVSSLTIDHEIKNNVIVVEYGNGLEFELDVDRAPRGNYNVYTLSDVHIEPSQIFFLANLTSFKRTYTIEPMERLLKLNGSYIISYNLNQRDVGRKYKGRIMIELLSIKDIVEIESDFVDFDAEEISINVKNNYDVMVPNVSARFSSVLFDVRAKFDLPASDSFTFKVPVSSEELRKVRNGNYLVDVVFETPRGSVATTGSIYLKEKKDIVSQDDETGFIFVSKSVTKINTGNTVEDVRIEIRKNILTQFFTSFNEEPLSTVRDGTDVRYYWSKRLAPAEVYTVRARTNYMYPIFILVILYLVYMFLRRVLRTKLVVEKTLTPVRTRNGEFALRVRILLKAKDDLESVCVVDHVPRMVKIYRKFGISMPDEIDAVTRRLKWNVGDMKSGEERMYTYVVYSRVGYLGKFSMPPAVSRFKFNEVVRRVESNDVFYSADGNSEE